jgi:hypothetical protein
MSLVKPLGVKPRMRMAVMLGAKEDAPHLQCHSDLGAKQKNDKTNRRKTKGPANSRPFRCTDDQDQRE